LYDLGGNVWEWCEDWYDGDQKYRVLRGASWRNVNRDHLLSSLRLGGAPGDRDIYYGLRVVLVGGSAP
jgi:formylglycine-generating enzyme required for sulfatase activity